MAKGRLLVGAAIAALAAGCQALPRDVQARSVDGSRMLRTPEPLEPTKSQLEAELAAARATLAAAPHDRDAAIWVARRLGYLGRYREAIDVLSAALDEHRDDPFLLRHRGHRWITLREFGKAAWDLERAAHACRTTPDELEPDGRPTPGRPPHSTLHYNVHYHLGLALFLASDFELAERAWLRCLAVVGNDESRVAVVHWLWCVRMRLGDPAGAAAVVASIRADLDVVENNSYLQLCLLYAGKLSREQIVPLSGSAGSALAFGLAHHRMLTGDRQLAWRELVELSRADAWSAFGVVAAEVEVQRFRH
jgi:tetratricopeptide (TPR) repeat protein